jgi:hypothetical protein
MQFWKRIPERELNGVSKMRGISFGHPSFQILRLGVGLDEVERILI